jgi:AcrR family transcriptional regulator
MKQSDLHRKLPKQARAKATVDAILEAAARILQTRGEKALTTNAIAALAGVSIGSLYQYFPDKRAIMVMLARQELAATNQAVNTNLRIKAPKDAPSDPVRARIRALLGGFKGRQRTRKALIEMLIANGLSDELTRPVDDIMRNMLAGPSGEPDAPARAMKPVTAYVLTRAVIGTLRAALMEQSAYLGKPEFEDELVKLVHGLLAAQQE